MTEVMSIEEEDLLSQKENDSTSINVVGEEEAIKNNFTPILKKMNSNSSIKSDDLYFYKSSSKFSEIPKDENINNKRDSFCLMDNFDNLYNNLCSEDHNLSGEPSNNLFNEKKDELPSFLKAALAKPYVTLIIDDETINIQNPICKDKEIIGIEDKPIEKEPEIIIKKPEISNCFVTKEEPIKKKLKRGKRGPYKKKKPLIIETDIEDKCFPFMSGKGLLSEEANDNKVNQYMNSNPFRTNKYITDSDGNKKREKKARKYKPDDIRKKIKVRFHKKIKNILNENLKKAGSQKLFSFLPQLFMGNISKKLNYQYMNKTFEELLLTNFSDFQKDYPNKECDRKQYEKNKETLQYLEENPQISKFSGFNKLKKMKYKDILKHYFSSIEFEKSIEQLDEEDEDTEYIQEYIYLAKYYIDYFTVIDDSR